MRYIKSAWRGFEDVAIGDTFARLANCHDAGQAQSAGKNQSQSRPQGQIGKVKASVRAKVEHPFRVIKCQFGFTKVRYKGLAKNTANLWMARKRIIQEALG